MDIDSNNRLINKHKATKLVTKYDWDDLNLPNDTLNQVKEVAEAIRKSHSFSKRLGGWHLWRYYKKRAGIGMLFTGSSGTGKTMTAAVLGKILGMDVYKIDLSSVISKYIGETEKRLDDIFKETQFSDAILYLDEVDTLFGKRTEVKDTHDRYANIEIPFLLDNVEKHSGAVILSTNLSNNIDKVFLRRIHYRIDFPLYLDVWERSVTALEDVRLSEPALSGPNTNDR